MPQQWLHPASDFGYNTLLATAEPWKEAVDTLLRSAAKQLENHNFPIHPYRMDAPLWWLIWKLGQVASCLYAYVLSQN